MVLLPCAMHHWPHVFVSVFAFKANAVLASYGEKLCGDPQAFYFGSYGASFLSAEKAADDKAKLEQEGGHREEDRWTPTQLEEMKEFSGRELFLCLWHWGTTYIKDPPMPHSHLLPATGQLHSMGEEQPYMTSAISVVND